jgi:4-hydroxy-tetrahydrodipicolinate reductase
MGHELAILAQSGYCGAELVGGVSRYGGDDGMAYGVPCASEFSDAVTDVDCVIDFSHHDATLDLLDFAKKHELPLVIATTGQTVNERAAISAASETIPIFFAANFSLGVALLVQLAKIAASTMKDAEIEIIEKHHDRKLDAPSGTALAIADAIKTVRPNANYVMGRSGHAKRTPDEIGIHAIRMGNIVGEHEVLVGTNTQTITLKHEAHSRALFAEGALAAAAWLMDHKIPGLYDMNSMLKF